MQRPRFMSLVFLALALALLGVQDFRWSLQAPVWQYRYDRFNISFLRWLLGTNSAAEPQSFEMLPPGKMQQLRADADRGDADAAAFTALYLPHNERETKFQLAEKAAQDPKLVWVTALVAQQYLNAARDPVVGDRYARWMERLTAADPDNAVAYLKQAQVMRARVPNWPSPVRWDHPEEEEFLLKQTAWLAAMDKAFHAPRYHDYDIEEFRLRQRLLSQRGWQSPWQLVAGSTRAIGDLFQIREYANLQATYLAPKDEKAGHLEAAVQRYYLVSNFGERIRAYDTILIDRLIGSALVRIGGKRLVPTLEKLGRHEESAGVVVQMDANDAADKNAGRSLALNDEFAAWLMRGLFAGVLVFGTLALLSLLYLTAKLFVRREVRGRLHGFVSVLESYTAVLFALCCFGLFLTYLPYAENFRNYMRADADIRDSLTVLRHSIPLSSWADPSANLHDPLLAYVLWAAAGLLLACLIAIIDARLGREHAAAHSAAAGYK